MFQCVLDLYPAVIVIVMGGNDIEAENETGRDTGRILCELADIFEYHGIVPFVVEIPPRTRRRSKHPLVYLAHTTETNRQICEIMRTGRCIELPMGRLSD